MIGVVCLKETQHVASRLREKNETPKHVASSFFVALPVLPKKKLKLSLDVFEINQISDVFTHPHTLGSW